MTCKKSCEEKALTAGTAGSVAGYGASLAAAATATPAATLFAGVPALGISPIVMAATAPVIAPALAAGLVGAGVAYLIKKALD
jgi:hypothetical protein